jgi:hypothetical protein
MALTFGQWHFGNTPGFCIVPGGLISRSGSTPWTVGGSSHVAQKQIYGLNSQFRRHFFRIPWPLTVHWGPRNHDDGTRTGFCLICFNCMSKFVETTTQEIFAILLWCIENRLGTKKIFCRQTTLVYTNVASSPSLVRKCPPSLSARPQLMRARETCPLFQLLGRDKNAHNLHWVHFWAMWPFTFIIRK